jgi:hypothetical protein
VYYLDFFSLDRPTIKASRVATRLELDILLREKYRNLRESLQRQQHGACYYCGLTDVPS